MAKALVNKIGVGTGKLYCTKVDGTTIVMVDDNDFNGVKQMRQLGTVAAPLAAERAAAGTITIVAVDGGGEISDVTVNGISVIAAPYAVTTLVPATEATGLAAAINAYTPVSGPKYFAVAVDNIVTLQGPDVDAEDYNNYVIEVTVSVPSIETEVLPLDGGSDSGAVYDNAFGLRFFLDNNSDATNTTISADAIEVTKIFAMRGLQTGIASVAVETIDDSIEIERTSAITLVDLSTDSSRLVLINPAGFVTGDILILTCTDGEISVEGSTSASATEPKNIFLTSVIGAATVSATSMIMLQYRYSDDIGGGAFFELVRTNRETVISGTPRYISRFNAAGTNIEDSKIFDNTPNAGYTDVRIYDSSTNSTYLQILVRDDNYSYLGFADTPSFFMVASDNGTNYMYDYCDANQRYISQKIGRLAFRDANNKVLVDLATTAGSGFTVASVPDSYVTANFKSASNCSGIVAAAVNTGNNYVHRTEGLVNVFGDIQISNHTIPDYEDTEASNSLIFSSFATAFVNSTTTPFAFVVGQSYKIVNYVAGDDFTNIANVQVGVINNTGCIFIATGTTPTTWTNSSEIGYDFAEIDNNQLQINNTGDEAVFNVETFDSSITAYSFNFDDNPAFQIFEEGVATLSGNVWDFGAGNNGGGTLGSPEDSVVSVVIDGETYSWNALKS